MPHFDIGYFKKKIKRNSISSSRGILNKLIAWKLDKDITMVKEQTVMAVSIMMDAGKNYYQK